MTPAPERQAGRSELTDYTRSPKLAWATGQPVLNTNRQLEIMAHAFNHSIRRQRQQSSGTQLAWST